MTRRVLLFGGYWAALAKLLNGLEAEQKGHQDEFHRSRRSRFRRR